MKNIKNFNNPEKVEKSKSVNLRDNQRKDEKNTEKTPLAYLEWKKYSEKQKEN